jgi:hypothetical protein
MNNLVNALETLYDDIVTIENHGCATRIRGFLVTLLHKDEFNLSHSDPNHPYTRFAKCGDAEGNRLRLFQAVQELLDEANSDLQPAVDMMFETPGTEQYTAVTNLLRKYKVYAEAQTGSNSDSDGDSDSS